VRTLEGKVAIVTGATGESGAAIAAALAGEGASIVGCGRSEVEGERVAQGLRDAGHDAAFHRTDVSVEDDVRRAVDVAMSRFGRLDVVVNNAAAMDIVRSGSGDTRVTEVSTEAVERIMKVGLFGPLWFFKYGIPRMLERDGGCFVSVSSLSAVAAYGGLPGYSSSKAALEALSRQVCADYGQLGIRSNIVRLGPIVVPGNEQVHEDEVFAAAERVQLLIPRLGRAEDLAAAVVYLASDASAYATASILTLDGGTSVSSPSPSVTAAWARAQGGDAGD